MAEVQTQSNQELESTLMKQGAVAFNDQYLGKTAVIDYKTKVGYEWAQASEQRPWILQIFPGSYDAQIENAYSYTEFGTFTYHATMCAKELAEIANEKPQDMHNRQLLNSVFLTSIFALAHARREGVDDETPLATVARARVLMRAENLDEAGTKICEDIFERFSALDKEQQRLIIGTAQATLYAYRIIHIVRFAFKAYTQEKIITIPDWENGDQDDETMRGFFFSFIMENRTPQEQKKTLNEMLEGIDSDEDIALLSTNVDESTSDTVRITLRPSDIRTNEAEPTFFTEMLDEIDDIINTDSLLASFFRHLAGDDKVILVQKTITTLLAIDAAYRKGEPIDLTIFPDELREFVRNIVQTVVKLAKKKGLEAGIPDWIEQIYYDSNEGEN